MAASSGEEGKLSVRVGPHQGRQGGGSIAHGIGGGDRHLELPLAGQFQDPSALGRPVSTARWVRRAKKRDPVLLGSTKGGDGDDPAPVVDESERYVDGFITAYGVERGGDSL